MCQSHLADQQLHQLLEKVDWDLAREACQQGCAYCCGKLHQANYERKARGGPQWDRRYSFCCAEQDCRRRRTPESVRFLGRRIYAGLVVVLVTTMIHGLTPARVRRIGQALQIDWRTLKRWAPMVAGSLCAQLLLESRPSEVHASYLRADSAFVAVVEI